ncbi:MAG: hypothetical protein ACREB9_00055 [Thermoplasmata archaeon]
MSPKKSSTSSGKRTTSRPRYLGIEVVGGPFPSDSPAAWHDLLAESGGIECSLLKFRVVRSQGPRAIVAVDQFALGSARQRWNRAQPGSLGLTLRTLKTWGTLVGAKAWLREYRRGGAERAPK